MKLTRIQARNTSGVFLAPKIYRYGHKAGLQRTQQCLLGKKATTLIIVQLAEWLMKRVNLFFMADTFWRLEKARSCSRLVSKQARIKAGENRAFALNAPPSIDVRRFCAVSLFVPFLFNAEPLRSSLTVHTRTLFTR